MTIFQVEGVSGKYHIHICGSVAEQGCAQSAICLESGSGSNKSASSFGISKVMMMDYKHEEEAVLMQYGGGDPCPPGRILLSGREFVMRLWSAG